LHQVIWTRCALQCPLFPTFPLSVPALVVIWSYLEQGYNSATGHSVWLVRSPETVYHWTFIRHLHYQRSKWCSRHICFLDPASVFSRVRAANIVRRPCSDSSHVTAPYKLAFYYYYYYYYYYYATCHAAWLIWLIWDRSFIGVYYTQSEINIFSVWDLNIFVSAVFFLFVTYLFYTCLLWFLLMNKHSCAQLAPLQEHGSYGANGANAPQILGRNYVHKLD